MSLYRYLGPMALTKMGGTMTLGDREITVPDAMLQIGDTIELDDEYAEWARDRGSNFEKADDASSEGEAEAGASTEPTETATNAQPASEIDASIAASQEQPAT